MIARLATRPIGIFSSSRLLSMPCQICLSQVSTSSSRRYSSTRALRNESVSPSSSLLSNTARGTAFENKSCALLESTFGMTLDRVGGANDGGIDLSGWWYLPKEGQVPNAKPAPAIPTRMIVVRNIKQPERSANYESLVAFAREYGDSRKPTLIELRSFTKGAHKGEVWRGEWLLSSEPIPAGSLRDETGVIVTPSDPQDASLRQNDSEEPLNFYAESTGFVAVPSSTPPSVASDEAGTDLVDEDIGRIRIIAQCKAEAKKLGPVILRELEGTLHRARLDATSAIARASEPGEELAELDAPLVGVLLSQSGFSKSTLIQALASPLPLMLVHAHVVPTGNEAKDEAAPLIAAGIVANKALTGPKGLLMDRMTIASKYNKRKDETRPVVLWDGTKLKPVRST